MTLKYLATGVAAAALIGAAAAGVTSIASPVAQAPNPTVASPAVVLANVDGLLPMDPATDLPSADQLAAVVNGLGQAGVPFASKSWLVEGGIGFTQGKLADRYFAGKLPLTATIGNIWPVAPGLAGATVTATGPGVGPVTQDLTFVNQGGWKLSRASVDQLIAFAGA